MPPEYINKLSQMFKDIKVSDDINEKFKNVARNTLHNANLAGLILNFKIVSNYFINVDLTIIFSFVWLLRVH